MASLHLLLAATPSVGARNIKLFLYHNRDKACFSTPFDVMPSEFKNGMVVGRRDAVGINLKLHELLTKYSAALERIEDTEHLTCAQLKKAMMRSLDYDGDTTFGSYAERIVSQLREDGRHSYATMVERSTRYFVDCFYDIPLRLIKPEHVEEFAQYLGKRKVGIGRCRRSVSQTYVGICLSHVKMVINMAIRERKVHYDTHPFLTTRIKRAPVRESSLSVENLNKIRCSEPTLKKYIVARDMFMLSFYLGGMNLKDMIYADYAGDEVRYVRSKTANRTSGEQIIVTPIIDDARQILDRYIRRSGKIDVGYKLSEHNLIAYVGRSIRELGDILDIDEDVVFYSARKTFAQIGLDIGIADSIIDAALGHSPSARGVISYYSKVKTKQVRLAIESIVEYMKNPEEQ